MRYTVCEISGRQYLIEIGKTIEVDMSVTDGKTVSIDKVLLIAKNSEVDLGTPYLKKTLKFEIVGQKKKPKVRVATYKAKANYRRVKGQSREVTLLKLLE